MPALEDIPGASSDGSVGPAAVVSQAELALWLLCLCLTSLVS